MNASAGLCGACRHARTIVNARGSRFVLCERSRSDPRFPRYPQLPVLRCLGFEPVAQPAGPGDEEASTADAEDGAG